MFETNSTDIKIFWFDSFVVVAPNKHGTRWLSESNYRKLDIINTSKKNNWKNKLNDILISINFKLYFVYRDPIECFESAIRTYSHAIHQGDSLWDGKNDKLDILLKKNGHLECFYYETLNSIVDKLNKELISFIHLNELSSIFSSQPVKKTTFKKELYSFPKNIQYKSIIGGIDSGVDIVELCKKTQTELWLVYENRLNIENNYLQNLIKRF